VLYPLSYEGRDVWAKVLEIRPYRVDLTPEGPRHPRGASPEWCTAHSLAVVGSAPMCHAAARVPGALCRGASDAVRVRWIAPGAGVAVAPHP